MSELQNQTPGLEQTSEQKSLKSLIQELHLPDEVIGGIEKITQDKREELILFLQEIQEDLKNGKITSPTDATDKARNILKEYNVTVVTEFNTENEKNKKEFKELSESLTKVKSLDPVVEDELQKAKQAKPNLPAELTKAVTDKTGVNIENLEDITTKGGEKQQDINNMIDAYYLANIDTTRITELLKGKKSEQEINESFATLRNSARHLDIPVYETAKNIEKLIPDQTDKTQKSVIETVNSLTKDNPDTRITRTGDTLRFTDPKDDKYSYEIDISRTPPALAKRLGRLSMKGDMIEKTPEEKAIERQQVLTQDDISRAINTSKDTPRTPELDNLGTDERYRKMEELFAIGKEENKRKNTTNGLLNTLAGVGIKAELLSSIIQERETKGEGDTADTKALKEKLRQTMVHRESLMQLQERYVKIARELGNTQKQEGTWQENAEISLNSLSDIGFQELGQDGMEKFIEAWNYQNRDADTFQIHFENGKINPLGEYALKVFIDRQLGTPGQTRDEKFHSLQKNLTDINFIQANWGDKKKRAQYLFAPKKTQS